MFGHLFSTRDKKPERDDETHRITPEIEDDRVASASIKAESDRDVALPGEKVFFPKIEPLKELLPVKEKIAGDYKIGDLFKIMHEIKASELYIGPDAPPYFRINGMTLKTDLDILSPDNCRELLCQVCSEEEIEDLEASGEIEFTFEVNDLSRFKINIFKQLNGYGGNFKKIPLRLQSYKNLNLSPIVSKIALYNRGLVIITGPSGSGKSSTMGAIIELINKQRNALIMTVENPVEFIHESKSSIVIHREIGTNVFSYKEALQSILKEDPDVVFIGGELDGPEIVEMALKAAEMGSLVFCLMHLTTSSRAIRRLLNFFPEEHMPLIAARLSTNLKAIIAQQLATGIDNKSLYVATEIMLNSAEIAELIRRGKIDRIDEVIAKSKYMGMQSMEGSIRDLFDQRVISVATAQGLGCDPSYLYPTGELKAPDVED